MAPLSEYRRKFKQRGEACQKDYVVRYNYMIGRRSTEMSHTPLDWDVPSDTDSEISSSRSDVVATPLKTAVKQGPNQVKKQTPQKNESTSTSNDGPVQVNDAAVQVNNKSVKSALKSQKEKDQEKSNNSKQTKFECRSAGHRTDSRSKVTEAKAASKSRGDKKDARPHSAVKARAPLIPYGWAYRGPIDNHKTFNVKVPEKEACQSALRALKRRQLDIQRKEEERKQQIIQKRNTEALFDLVEKDKSGWVSEYKRNFSGYKFNF